MNNLIGIYSSQPQMGKDTVAKIIQWLSIEPYCNEEIKDYLHYFYHIDKYTFNLPHNFKTFEIKKFAGKLKEITCLLLGCTMEQLEDNDFKNKELGEEWWKWQIEFQRNFESDFKYFDYLNLDINLLKEEEESYYDHFLIKMTPRLLLQLLGTECGREIIHPQIWVNSLFSDYKKIVGASNAHIPSNTNDYTYFKYPNWIISDMRFPNEYQAIKDRKGICIRVDRDLGSVKKETHSSESQLDNYEFDYLINNNESIEGLIKQVQLIYEQEISKRLS